MVLWLPPGIITTRLLSNQRGQYQRNLRFMANDYVCNCFLLFFMAFNFLPNCKIFFQLARDQAQKSMNQGLQSETNDTSNAAASSATTSTATNAASSNTLTSNGLASSPYSTMPITATDPQQLVSGLSGTSVSHATVTSSSTGVEPSTVVTVSTASTTAIGSGVATNSHESKMPSMYKFMFCSFIFLL